MMSAGGWGGGGAGARVGEFFRSEGKEPGERRKKLAGYLKAANELRQTYQQSYNQSWDTRDGAEDSMPGAYPDDSDVASARKGQEEMIIFPSYARRHVKRKPGVGSISSESAYRSDDNIWETPDRNDPEHWRQEWDQYEDENAVVDVDVRGWFYTAQRGPLNRKNRVFVGLARQLVGLPAPSQSPGGSNTNSRSSSPHGMRQRVEAHKARHEEELAAQHAESIRRKGEAEAEAAKRGVYSETPADDASIYGDDSREGKSSLAHRIDDGGITPLQKQDSWSLPTQMSQAELNDANHHLMVRLKPFLAIPLANLSVSAFFYNDSVSRQKTTETDAYGHFTINAALDFVPTHVRILAADGLSATEEVLVTESKGVSIISDIDDTIKHSAIGSGAREIFRNVFIRHFNDLFIQGVREWYKRLADIGVTFHYVSNSPWQLYPMLSAFFSKAGLPKGSFHLKKYSGMLQGIFEPVAERKKGTLEKIMRDFPERRFILIGDSGEADLEVYTDVVLENPGRVLGVYIRDVTTSEKRAFFDSSMVSLAGERAPKPKSSHGRLDPNTRSYTPPGQLESSRQKPHLASSFDDLRLPHTTQSQMSQIASDFDEGKRPQLPPRRQTEPPPQEEEEDLIDLDFDYSKPTSDSRHTSSGPQSKGSSNHPTRPPLPPKPALFSSSASTTGNEGDRTEIKRKAAPPPPRKPSTSVQTSRTLEPQSTQPSEPSDNHTKKAVPPPPPPKRKGYTEAAKEKLNAAYNQLPSPTAYIYGSDSGGRNATESQQQLNTQQSQVERRDPRQMGFSRPTAQERSTTTTSLPSVTTTATHATSPSNASAFYGTQKGEEHNDEEEARPPLPSRSTLGSYTATAAQYASSLYNNYAPSTTSSPTKSFLEVPTASQLSQSSSALIGRATDGPSPAATAAQHNRKEELWRRRWVRAKGILEERGVVLKSWRVGEDVADDVLELVRKAQ